MQKPVIALLDTIIIGIQIVIRIFKSIFKIIEGINAILVILFI